MKKLLLITLTLALAIAIGTATVANNTSAGNNGPNLNAQNPVREGRILWMSGYNVGELIDENTGEVFEFHVPGGIVDFIAGDLVSFVAIKLPNGKFVINKIGRRIP